MLYVVHRDATVEERFRGKKEQDEGKVIMKV